MIHILVVSILSTTLFAFVAESADTPSPEIYLQLGHSGPVNSVSYSPDGKFIVSGSDDNTVRIWDVATKKPIRTLAGHTSAVTSVDFSSDGVFIVSGSKDNTVRIWEFATGILIRKIAKHSNSVNSVAFSPDGKTVASGSGDGTVRISEAITGRQIHTLDSYSYQVFSVAFSPDSSFIAGGCGDNMVKIWDATSGKLIRTLTGHRSVAMSVDFSPDGKFVASGSADNTVRIWDAVSGHPVRTITGHMKEIRSIKYSPDAKFIVSGSGDNTIRIWAAATGNQIRSLSNEGSPLSVCYSPNGEFIVFGTGGKEIKIWNMSSGDPVQVLTGYKNEVWSVDFSPDGKFLASGSDDGTFRIWDVALRIPVLSRSNSGRVLCVSYSPDGKFVACVNGIYITLWGVPTGNMVKSVKTEDFHTSLKYSSSGAFIVSGAPDKHIIMVFDITNEKIIIGGRSFVKKVRTVSLSPDEKLISSGFDDGTIEIASFSEFVGSLSYFPIFYFQLSTTGHRYNIESCFGGYHRFREFHGHTDSVSSVNFSPDGKTVVSGSDDNTVRVWDTESGDQISVMTGHTDSINSVNFSPDGKFVVSGSTDNTVRIWDATMGDNIKILAGHSDAVKSVIFSPDGKIIATSSSDNTIRIWNAISGQQLAIFVLLPGNEWLAWQPGKPFYLSSRQGDEYAAIRFDNRTYPIYPLKYYRKELKHYNWLEVKDKPQPKIKPKSMKLWWDLFDLNQFLRHFALILGLSSPIIILLLRFIRRRFSDPMKVSRQFFLKTGYKKAEPQSSGILSLSSKAGATPGLVVVWGGGLDVSGIAETVQNFSEKIGQKIKIYLVCDGKMPSAEPMQMLRGKTECEVIPVRLPVLEKALSSETTEGIVRTLREIEDPFVTRIDPYSESKPVKDATWFYGREQTMARIPQILAQGQHLCVCGLRKIGKTSLVSQIRQRFAKSPTIFIDCQSISANAVECFGEIIKQLDTDFRALGLKDLSSSRPVSGVDDFRNRIFTRFDVWEKSGGNEPFVIILDEIDKFFPPREMKQSENILSEYAQLFGTLRGIAQARQCLVTLVVAYRPNLNRHNLLTPVVGENPMFKSFTEEFLGFLTFDESEAMIREIGMWKDIKWEKDAAKMVFHYCGGHPLVSRYFASRACEEGSLKHVDMAKVEQTAGKIRDTFYNNEIGNYYKEGVWALMDDKEKEILSLAARQSEKPVLKADIQKDMKEALASLEHFGLVTVKDGALHLTSQLFIDWLGEIIDDGPV